VFFYSALLLNSNGLKLCSTRTDQEARLQTAYRQQAVERHETLLKTRNVVHDIQTLVYQQSKTLNNLETNHHQLLESSVTQTITIQENNRLLKALQEVLVR
jgi:hypothetical protein